jgi:hypothetical protein
VSRHSIGWIAMYEGSCALPLSVPFGEMFNVIQSGRNFCSLCHGWILERI